MTMYKALIIFSIDYASVIYSTAKINILSTLNSIHNQGIQLATRAFRTSPIESILYIAVELPLQLRRHRYLLIYIYK